MTILFLSDIGEDAHLLPVAAELGRRGREVRLFNPGDFPGEATVTVEGGAREPATRLSWQDQELDLAAVSSVWLRRPGRVRLSDRLPPAEGDWVRGECNDFLGAVWANCDALWVSRPDRLRGASLKLLQLKLAAGLGFRVPHFVCTNVPAQARAFVDAHPGGVVTKVLTVPVLSTPERVATLYTHLLTKEDLTHLDSVRHGPTFLQEFVRKQEDVRVTVIGDAVFAVGIDPSGAPEAVIDFRRVETLDLPHRPLALPPAVRDACLALVRRLGLRFGAIDLLLTPDGEYVFLEINPNGQWLWIEMVTDLPLTRAMADLLCQGRDASEPRVFAVPGVATWAGGEIPS